MSARQFSFEGYREERKRMGVTQGELVKRIEESAYGRESKELLRRWLKVESTGEPGFAVFRCPPIIDSGSGATVRDADGKEYLDRCRLGKYKLGSSESKWFST